MASTAATTESYPSNLPLTPRDSDNEATGEPSQMAGRKRSASEMEDESGKRKQKTAGSTASNAPETIEAEVSADFSIQCPALPQRGKKAAGDDVVIDTDAPLLAPHLTINYAVRPGKKWSDLSRFKNAKFKDPFVVIYTAGQIIYVNRHSPIPPPPAPDASEDERLRYDQENFWVGLISEFRAESQEKVYVKVFWLYWPDELPGGRQPYHGQRELILSNHVDIIEAQTIATHAEVSFWDENDDSNKNVLQERYWRQTLDLKKAKDGKNALSKLRKFCICGEYDNPSVDMYQCHKPQRGCGLWNHQACLYKDLEERAWANFLTGTLTHESEEERSLGVRVGETIGNLVKPLVSLSGEIKDSATPEKKTPSKGNRKTKGTPAKKLPWAGKLKAKIETTSGDVHHVTVSQLVPTPASKGAQRFEPKVWRMKLRCLNCGEILN